MNYLFQALIVVFLFFLIHLFLTMSMGISHIKNNWEQYKCNPGIIPFAGVFDKDPIDNAKECVQTIQMDFMRGFLEPLYQAFGSIASFGAQFGDLFEGVKEFGNANQLLSLNVFTDLRGRMIAMGHGIKDVFNDLEHGLSAFGMTITVIFYSLDSIVNMFSMANQEIFGFIIDAIESFAG
tara:strand:- start:589 stop:1128 length:540 start_codon:yes stop_codon:yes gene_type:complete